MRELSQQVTSSDTAVLSEQVVGRGQVNPGPSRFALSATMAFVSLVVLLVLVPTQFLFGTFMVGRVPDLPSAVVVSLVSGLAYLIASTRDHSSVPPIKIRVFAALLGAAAGSLVPLMVSLSRHTDAPSGSLVAFWTTVVPATLLLVLGIGVSPRARATAVAAAAAVVFASAGILANWERPSSFNLFARHVAEQGSLALAAVILSAALVGLAFMARRTGWGVVMRFAGFGALASAAVLAMATGDAASVVRAFLDMNTIVYATSGALVVVASSALIAVRHAWIPAAGLALAPAMLSTLVVVEAAVGALGPEPILRTPVVWGAAAVACALALAAVAEASIRRSSSVRERSTGGLFAAVLSGLVATSAVASLVGLVAPALDVSVQGRLADASIFSADFQMRGFETVGGWLALSVAAIAFSMAVWKGGRLHQAVASLSIFVTSAAWYVLGHTPLRTWVSWIPADVQQDYGTEYARIGFEPLGVMPQQVAVIAAVSTAVSVVVWVAWTTMRPGTGPESGLEKGGN